MFTTEMYLFEGFFSRLAWNPYPSHSVEAFPLHVREMGMSFAIATTWYLNSRGIWLVCGLVPFWVSGRLAFYARDQNPHG